MNKNLKPIFEIVAFATISLAPLSLFYIDYDLYFLFITGKNFAFRLMVEIAFVSWVSLALLDQSYRIDWRNNYILWAISAFILAALIANMQGINPYRSFWSYAERMDGFLSILHLFMYFVVLVAVLKTRNMFHWLLQGVLAIGLVLSFLALGDITPENPNIRISGLLGNPIYLGALSIFCIFIAIYFASMKEKLWDTNYLRECIYGAVVLFFMYIIVKTGTRGTLMGLGVGAFVTAVLVVTTTKFIENKPWWWISVLTLVSIITALVMFLFRAQMKTLEFVQNNYFLNRLTDISLDDRTTIYRITNWEMGLQGLAERPFFGWGQENYATVFSKFYNSQILHDAEEWYDRTHNALIDWLVFTGIVGFTAYIIIFVIALFVLWRRNTAFQFTNLQKSMLTGLIIGYLFQNAVAFDSLVSGIYLFILFAFIAICQKSLPQKATTKSSKKKKVSKQGVTNKYAPIVITIMIGFTGWWVNYSILRPISHSHKFIEFVKLERVAQSTSYHPDIARVLEESLNMKSQFTSEFLLRSLIAVPNILGHGNMNADLANKMTATVEQHTDAFLEKYPNHIRILNSYGNYNVLLQRTDEADIYTTRALAISPSKLQLNWLMSDIRAQQGRVEEQLEYLKKAHELAPESPRAKFLYTRAQERFDKIQ